MLILKGDPRMTLYFNRGKAAGESGYKGRCPYVSSAKTELVFAWEQGRDQALEVAA